MKQSLSVIYVSQDGSVETPLYCCRCWRAGTTPPRHDGNDDDDDGISGVSMFVRPTMAFSFISIVVKESSCWSLEQSFLGNKRAAREFATYTGGR